MALTEYSVILAQPDTWAVESSLNRVTKQRHFAMHRVQAWKVTVLPVTGETRLVPITDGWDSHILTPDELCEGDSFCVDYIGTGSQCQAYIRQQTETEKNV